MTKLQQMTDLLERWLEHPGRTDDAPTAIEIETAKLLGHADSCELVDYDVCTCGAAERNKYDPRLVELARRGFRVSASGLVTCIGCGQGAVWKTGAPAGGSAIAGCPGSCTLGDVQRVTIDEAIAAGRDAIVEQLTGTVVERGGVAIVFVMGDGHVAVSGNMDARGTHEALQLGAKKMAQVA